jgi:hypothetical protein
MSDERELIITSATIVKPGDKVLLVLPAETSREDMWEFKARLDEWAPGTDWLLVCGAEAVYQKLAEDSP